MRDELQAACLVDGIELFEAIGQGGSATVWRARWQERDVAIKVLGSGHDGRPPRPLPHPAILGVLGQGRALGKPYLILERYPTDLGRFLDGRPLRADLRRRVLLPLLDAIEFAHRRGVLHGDIKPANVLLDPDPIRVALADFGHGEPVSENLAASMLSGEQPSSVSTLAYLAPERRAGEPASVASDVYALGVLLFEVLTGRLPIGLELPSELEPSVERGFDRVVKRAMARVPASRPAVTDLRRELLRLLPTGAVAPSEDSADMVYIPGGDVTIGDPNDPDASPIVVTPLASFFVDLTQVTNGAYLEFTHATKASRPRVWPGGRGLPREMKALPVSGITWDEAQAYAAWSGKRLLTEAEWERVARGPQHQAYPYGERLDLSLVHTDPRSLASVGSYPDGASSEGVLDLTGNGWEWTATRFARYGSEPTGSARVIRGGYDSSQARSASASYRRALRPDARDPGVTFRCALDAEI